MRHVHRLSKWLFNVLHISAKVLTFVLTVLLTFATWLLMPGLLTSMFDLNLSIIKFVPEYLPWLFFGYADQFEPTMRLLAGEKAMYFLEVSLFIRIVGWLCVWSWRRRKVRRHHHTEAVAR